MLHIGNIEADEFGTPKSTCKSYQQQSLIAPVFRAASHLGCEIAPNSDPTSTRFDLLISLGK